MLFIFDGSTMPINIMSFLNDESACNVLRLNETFFMSKHRIFSMKVIAIKMFYA